MEERIPRGDTRGMTPIIHFELQFHFARDAQARWPMETAVPKAHPGKVMNYFYNYFPQEYFLSVKLDPVDEASQYMDKHLVGLQQTLHGWRSGSIMWLIPTRGLTTGACLFPGNA